jgi:hypothetical protein
MFFRDRKLTIFGSLGPMKPRIRECVKFGHNGLVKRWGHEHAEARNLELATARTSVCRGPSSRVTRGDMHESSKKRKPKSGICRGPGSGVTREDIHEPTEK